MFNTGRHVGRALAIAVFGALVASREIFLHGLRASLLIAAPSPWPAAVSLLLKPAAGGITPRLTTDA